MASLIVAKNTPSADPGQTETLESALAELDSLPTVLFRDGSAVLEGGWHEELSLKHKLTSHSKIGSRGVSRRCEKSGRSSDPAPRQLRDFLVRLTSPARFFTMAAAQVRGARVSRTGKNFQATLELAALYSWAGALTPTGDLDASSVNLRDSIATRNHQSVAARISGKLPRAGTQFSASYKWVAGATLTPTDAFGEAANQIDTNLHLHPPAHSRLEWAMGSACRFQQSFGAGICDDFGPGCSRGLCSSFAIVPGGVSFQF